MATVRSYVVTMGLESIWQLSLVQTQGNSKDSYEVHHCTERTQTVQTHNLHLPGNSGNHCTTTYTNVKNIALRRFILSSSFERKYSLHLDFVQVL